LSPDTSSHQISTKNLHSFRRYRAEGNIGLKVTGSRSKVASTRFFRATHLCPLIHPLTKYQNRLRFEDTVQCGRELLCNFGSRSMVASTQIFSVTHLCPSQYQSKILIRLGDAERKGISVSRSQDQGQRSHRHDSFAWHTFVPWYPPTKYLQSYRNNRAEGKYTLVAGSGHGSKNIKHPPQLTLAGMLNKDHDLLQHDIWNNLSTLY
jgi:hypothetical protein